MLLDRLKEELIEAVKNHDVVGSDIIKSRMRIVEEHSGLICVYSKVFYGHYVNCFLLLPLLPFFLCLFYCIQQTPTIFPNWTD